MSSRTSYDNTGAAYDVTKILNDDTTLNFRKYEAYSPLFLSTTFAVSYGLSFASITGLSAASNGFRASTDCICSNYHTHGALLQKADCSARPTLPI